MNLFGVGKISLSDSYGPTVLRILRISPSVTYMGYVMVFKIKFIGVIEIRSKYILERKRGKLKFPRYRRKFNVSSRNKTYSRSRHKFV